ncbi:MAG: polysaccharide biosynthesis C-terminal domain-containing protein [Geminicoccaceae bacterium]
MRTDDGAFDALLKRLAKGASLAFVINVAAVGLGFAAQLILARGLGAVDYGLFAYVVAWVTVLALITRLGFPTSVLRFLPPYRRQQKGAAARGLLRFAQSASLLCSFGAAILGLALIVVIHDRLTAGLATVFAIGLAALPVIALLPIHCAALRAFDRVTLALVPDRLVPQAVLVVAVGACLILLPERLDATSAMVFRLLGFCVALAIVILPLIRLARGPGGESDVAMDDKPLWIAATRSLVVLAALQAVRRHADVLLIGMLLDTTEAGIFRISAYVASLVAFPLGAINTVFAPVISTHYAEKEIDRLQKIVTRTARWSLGSALLIALPLLVAPAWTLGWFGEAFQSGAAVLVILVLAQLVNAAIGSVTFLMTMTGHEREATFVFAASAAASVALTIILVPMFGIIGAAVATAFGLVSWNLALAIFVRRRLGVTPSIFGA